MRYRSKRVLLLSLLILFVQLFNVITPVYAAQAPVYLSQGILPVYILYFSESGQVERIWSNVSPYDTAYTVQGMAPDGTRISMNESLLQEFFLRKKEYLSPTDVISLAEGVKNHVSHEQPLSEDSRFFARNGVIEEIRTVL